LAATHQFVHAAACELLELNIALYVLLSQLLQFRVQLRIHLVAAHVHHRLVELFQRIFYGLRELDGDNGLLELHVRVLGVVIGQYGLS